jgi:fatty acid desaturase
MRVEARPVPVDLTHLRPDDVSGLAAVAATLAATAAGIALSAAGGWMAWAAGQALLGVMLVQWFVVLHECGHDTLFRTRRLHTIGGHVAAFFSLIPYHAWTRVHGKHHKWTGWQDLDPTTASLVPRPLGRAERAIVNVCWRFWIPLFSVIYRVSNYWHYPRLFRMFTDARDRRALVRDAVILIGLYAALVWWLGAPLVLRIFGAAILVSLTIEDLLLLSQHTHVPQNVSHGESVRPFPTIEQEAFTRSLRLPPIVSSFILHFDAHELHHMYPFVPGYHLRRIPYETENEVGWWRWVRGAKQLRGDVLLFQNRADTGWDI